MVVCSLNHDITTSLGLGLSNAPIFRKSTPTCTGITVKGCTHMPIHSISRCSNILYIQYGCGMQSLGVCLNHNLTTSYRLSHTPIFLKFTPTCTMHQWHKDAPICPSTASHVAKTLMKSMGVCSLNHDTAISYRLGHTRFFLKFTPTCTMY